MGSYPSLFREEIQCPPYIGKRGIQVGLGQARKDLAYETEHCIAGDRQERQDLIRLALLSLEGEGNHVVQPGE